MRVSLVLVLYWCFAGAVGYDVWTSPPPSIYSLHIRSEIQFRFATTLVTSRVANAANHTQDVTFEISLPEAAFISDFSMEIDGQVYPGTVKGKLEAQKDYDRARRRGQSAGLVEQAPRASQKFKVKVLLAAESKVTFNLIYQELLKRSTGLYEHIIIINSGQPVEDMQINVAILESRDLTVVNVPPMRDLSGLLTNKIDAGVSLQDEGVVTVSRPSSRTAFISYSPSLEDQHYGLSGQFIVQYDIDRSLDSGDLLVVNGYFVHFIAPPIEEPISRDVVFIVDVSRSMVGTKIEQCKDSLYAMLDQLKPGDRFNIIKFSSAIKFYKPKVLIDVTGENLHEAKVWVKSIEAAGETNINDGLTKGVHFLAPYLLDVERSPVIVFLTDGYPTDGVTRKDKILSNVHYLNEGQIPIYSLAFGHGADWNLVKMIASQNYGVARKIYEDADADLQIAGFYDEIAVTLLNDVEVHYLGEDVDDESLTQANFKNYFKGSEMIVAGKLNSDSVSTLNLKILAKGAEGKEVKLGEGHASFVDPMEESLMDISDFSTITEKLWAYLSIQQQLYQAEGQVNSTIKYYLKERAKQLSIEYGFVTPLTSMVVVKPDVKEDRPSTKTPTTTIRAPRRYYVGGGGYGGGGGGDPHFMVRVGTVEHPLCFDVENRGGDVLDLLTDERHGIKIRTQIIESSLKKKNGDPKTYMGQISIQTKNHVVIVTPEGVFYDEQVYTWEEVNAIVLGEHAMQLVDEWKHLSIKFKFGAEIIINRHWSHAQVSGEKFGYLSFYVNEEDGFSSVTTGLIGQFVNGQKHIKLRKEYNQESGKHVGKFLLKEGPRFLSTQLRKPVGKPDQHSFVANLVDKSDAIANGTEKCWMVHAQYEHVLYGDRSTYMAPSLLDV